MGQGIRKISVRGGPPELLTELAQRVSGYWWDTDDTILFSSTEEMSLQDGYLVRISSTGGGGTPEVVTTPEQGSAHTYAQPLPDGRHILFTIRDVNAPASDGSIAIFSLENQQYETLIARGYNARYAPTGHIVFVRSGTLWAVPFDLDRLEITGTAVPMVNGVHVSKQPDRAGSIRIFR